MDIVRRGLDAEDNYNLLFIGPPASAKTLFLLGIYLMAATRNKQNSTLSSSSCSNRFTTIKNAKLLAVRDATLSKQEIFQLLWL
jgi:hypothetical protein